MARTDDEDLKAAKRGYKAAEREGNNEEAAKWANTIADIHKRRAEYVEAIRWLRIDYEVSIKHLPQKQLLPTCQSLGEVYLRLERFKDALLYQKKHLGLAKDSDDLIEQQRASTQLGRTYHEIFLRSDNDHSAIRNAKKYFKLAMKLARNLKESTEGNKSSFFLKEFIDSHNNIGMLEMDLDNLEEAEAILLQGLKICDEEEVSENDDTQSRLHHNLGTLYIELRKWAKAREHIEKDILICKNISHPQGEAKGFINLGELHYRVQKYDDAVRCYQKALDIAKCLEDEDALVDQINQNISIVQEATKVLENLQKDEQKLKKIMRNTHEARGTPNERKCLLEQNGCLDGLIEKASMIFAWTKHREFAKRKKRVASELCDKEKLSDSYLVIGESYQKLRNFIKARKWYMKSWNMYRSIGNLEGQALVKINIGEVLDTSGDWAGALEAFEEGYRLAVQGNLPTVQMSALDNMHYSHMIRFDNVDQARKLQHEIDKLKCLLKEGAAENPENDYCSETKTEGAEVSDDFSGRHNLPDDDNVATSKPSTLNGFEEFDDDTPLASLVRQRKNPLKKIPDSHGMKMSSLPSGAKPSSHNLTSDGQQPPGRKRVRVVISDDEANDPGDISSSRKRLHKIAADDFTISCSENKKAEQPPLTGDQDILGSTACKNVFGASTPTNAEESTCSIRCGSPANVNNNTDTGYSSEAEIVATAKYAAAGSKTDSVNILNNLLQGQNDAGVDQFRKDHTKFLKFEVSFHQIYVDITSCTVGGNLDIEGMKVVVACTYFLQLPKEKRSKGLLPIIGDLQCRGKTLCPVESLEDVKHLSDEDIWIEVVIEGWVPKRLMKLYIDHCEKISEPANMKLLTKLYNLEISEDEVIISDCGLQDLSIIPFFSALEVHKMIATLDVSHNLLGNESMEKLRQIFCTSSQKYGGLTLDLHCNRFGPTALFQICECPVMFARLEVLNLSENRLTDACSSYLSTILQNCKALYSLNIEQCSITSRTIQKVSDALYDECVLSHLSIGKNNPISGHSLIQLLSKLKSLKRFSGLSLTGIKLSKIMIDSLCQFVHSSSVSVLMLGGTCLGTDGAVRLTEALVNGSQELVKLDLSNCGLTCYDFPKICVNFSAIGGISELNLGGNSIGQEGSNALEAILMDSRCALKCIILNNCHLGLEAIVRIIKTSANNDSVEELHLAENADFAQDQTLQYDQIRHSGAKKSSVAETSNEIEVYEEHHGLEVADSEDEETKEQPHLVDRDGSCASSCQKNSYADHELVRELSEAIASAKQLQLLDLSRNGFSSEAVESLYDAWSMSRYGTPSKHVEKRLIHFFVDDRKCCVRSCCRRD